MKSLVVRPLLAAALAMSAYAGTHAAPLSDAQVRASANELIPFATRIDEVFARATIEGRAVTTLRFEAPVSTVRALRAASDAWARLGATETVSARTDAWHLLSARLNGSYWTLQVRDSAQGGSAGLVSVWHELEAESPHATGASINAASDSARRHPLLPPDAVVLRSVAAVDAGRRGETVVAVSANGREWVARAITASATAAGYTAAGPRDDARTQPEVPTAMVAGLVPKGKRALRPTEPSVPGETLFLRSARAEVAVTLVDGQGGTAIVVHTRELHP